jgi:hypothetical protein
LKTTIKIKLWLLNKLAKWLNADECLKSLEREKKRSASWAETANQYAMNADYWRAEVAMRDRHKPHRIRELEAGLKDIRNSLAAFERTRDDGYVGEAAHRCTELLKGED